MDNEQKDRDHLDPRVNGLQEAFLEGILIRKDRLFQERESTYNRALYEIMIFGHDQSPFFAKILPINNINKTIIMTPDNPDTIYAKLECGKPFSSHPLKA